MKPKLAIILLYIVLFSVIITAEVIELNQFSDGSSSGTINFPSPFCYQETANESSSCGGISTGVYQTGIPYTIVDGNYSTYDQFTGGTAYEINYTKNLSFHGAIWTVKDDNDIVNLTVPDACYDYDSTTLLLRVWVVPSGLNDATRWQCYNESGWHTLRDIDPSGRVVYEESIHWNISLQNKTISIPLYSNITNANFTVLGINDYLTIDENLTSYWRFDKSINDEQNEYNFTNSSNITIEENGYIGAAYYFNHSFVNVDVPDEGNFNNFSICLWFYSYNNITYTTEGLFQTGIGNYGDIILYGTGDGRLIYHIRNSATKGYSGYIGDITNEWHHVCVSVSEYSGSNQLLTLFYDGEYNGSHDGDTYSPTLKVLNIGSSTTDPNYFFDGLIDEVYLFNNSNISHITAAYLYNTTTPSNVSFIINENNFTDYNHTKMIGRDNVTLNTSSLNKIIRDGCNCTGCSSNLSHCEIPIYIDGTNGSLNYTFSNLSYEYWIDNCSNGYIPSLNFTLYDETTNELINGSIEINLDVNYIGDLSLNYINNTTNTICISPYWAVFNTDLDIYYSSTGYPQRRYTDTGVELDNQSSNIDLYLLSSNDGIYIRFRTTDVYSNILSGTVVQMRISGETSVLEQESTDASGIATFWVNPDTDYNFTFTKTGYQTSSFILRPTTTEIYTVELSGQATTLTLSDATGVLYDFYPKDAILSNDTNYNFTFNLTSTVWNITTCTFYLKNQSNTILSQLDGTLNGSFCTSTINYNTTGLNSIISEANYTINGTNLKTVNREYIIKDTTKGQFSLMNFFDDLTSFSEAGFNDLTRMILAFIVIFALVAISSHYLELNNPDISIGLIMALVWAFSYLGWFTITSGALPPNYDNLSQYLIFYLVLLLGSGLIMWRNR